MPNNKQIRDVARLSIIVVLSLVACAQQTLVSPLATPESVLPTPVQSTATVTVTPKPTNTATATYTPWPTKTPAPTITPTFAPYADEPFKMIIWRDDQMWFTEVGSGEETPYIIEQGEWEIEGFAISTSCDKWLYLQKPQPPERDAHMKILRFDTGEIVDVDGPEDPYVETYLYWIDDTHIAYQISDIASHVDPLLRQSLTENKLYQIFVRDLASGEITFYPRARRVVQSPNGRYLLLEHCGDGSGVGRMCTPSHELHDTWTGEQWRVAGGNGDGSFCGWSSDSQWMCFNAHHFTGNVDNPLQLLVMNPEERYEHYITRKGMYTYSATWSPASQSLAYFLCSDDECSIYVYDVESDTSKEIMGGLPHSRSGCSVRWSPDGQRLIFRQHSGMLDDSPIYWSVRLDGSDLRAILEGGWIAAVCQP